MDVVVTPDVRTEREDETDTVSATVIAIGPPTDRCPPPLRHASAQARPIAPQAITMVGTEPDAPNHPTQAVRRGSIHG